MKTIIKKILRFFGLQIRRIPRNFNLHPKNEEEILSKIIKNKEPVILDVGANNGASISRFEKLFINPKILSFEPLPEQFRELKKFENENVEIFNFALGDKNEIKNFYVNEKHDTSSFLKIKSGTEWLKKRAKVFNVNEKKFTKSEIKVKVKKLDDILISKNIEKIDLLKIDTQGYEAEVLAGSIEHIQSNKIKNIECELILGSIYEKSLSFYDIEKYLIPNGYKIIFMSSAVNGMNIFDNPDLSFRSIIYSCEKNLN